MFSELHLSLAHSEIIILLLHLQQSRRGRLMPRPAMLRARRMASLMVLHTPSSASVQTAAAIATLPRLTQATRFPMTQSVIIPVKEQPQAQLRRAAALLCCSPSTQRRFIRWAAICKFCQLFFSTCFLSCCAGMILLLLSLRR